MSALLLCATTCSQTDPLPTADASAGRASDAQGATDDGLGAKPAVQPDTAGLAPCLAQPVGNHGVGKPCSANKDCFGQFAVTCLTDLGAAAPRFCTEYCFGFADECEGGVCMPRGKQPAICVPPACAARYAVPVPVGVTCTEDCVAPPSALGVGKPCTTHEHCAGQIAQSCPYVFRPDNQKWCTMLCSEDEECGAGAVCWKRKTTESGNTFTIGSCANAACCWMP
ncbi:MAG: hypothetical protein EXR79_02350 [Myxococcales bacterium]|nr:hypothetical protein [Myxococcales bacterium]